MTEKTRTETAWESKKFKAFVLSNLVWTCLIGACFIKYVNLDVYTSAVILIMVVAQGTVQTGYILGTAGLDAWQHVLEVVSRIITALVPGKDVDPDSEEPTAETPVPDENKNPPNQP